MTTTEAKEAARVLKAYAANKQVQCKAKRDVDDVDSAHHSFIDEWERVGDNHRFNFERYEYRLAQPSYRHFRDCEELVNEACRRFGLIKTSYGLPFVWLRWKETLDPALILGWEGSLLRTSCEDALIEDVMDKFTFYDGSVCGVKE